jgi:hypothetical protein
MHITFCESFQGFLSFLREKIAMRDARQRKVVANEMQGWILVIFVVETFPIENEIVMKRKVFQKWFSFGFSKFCKFNFIFCLERLH